MPVYVWVNFLKFISVGLIPPSPFGAEKQPAGLGPEGLRPEGASLNEPDGFIQR